MAKDTYSERDWERFERIREANRSEWNRLVIENHQLIRDIQAIRRRYGFPPSYDAALRVLKGFAEEVDKKYSAGQRATLHYDALVNVPALVFRKASERELQALAMDSFRGRFPQMVEELKKLAQRYSLSWEKFGRNLEMLTLFGAEDAPLRFHDGSLKFTVESDGAGGAIIKEQLDEHTDITNPITQEFLAQIHKNRVLAFDPVPLPQPRKDNPRALDWRPVWEWKKRHPEFTHEDIALMIDYKPHRVRLKLAELDSAN